LIVVTHNVSEFGRLAGLIVEDWSWQAGVAVRPVTFLLRHPSSR